MLRKWFYLSTFFLTLAACGFFFFVDPFHAKKGGKFTTAYRVSDQKRFVVIIPSYNNEKYIEKNLQSVFAQTYDNYRVIYIDDHSTDQTLAQAKELLPHYDKEQRTTLIHNTSNRGALANYYNAIQSCDADEIAVLLDGDDFLAHEGVLTRLNEIYADPDVWLTYGNYLDYPSFTQNTIKFKEISPKTIKKHSYRSDPWMGAPLRTFYVSLFRKIKIDDLFYRGRFYTMASDLAFFLPLLEMSGEHAYFIDECLYLYNRINPINDHKVNFTYQNQCSKHIRQRKPYAKLSSMTPTNKTHNEKPDLVIFTEDNPTQLLSLLDSIEHYVEGLGNVTILFSSHSPEIVSAYLSLSSDYPNYQFIQQKGDFKRLLQSISFDNSSSAYILFAQDNQLITDQIDLGEAVQALLLSHAYGLYFANHAKLQFSSALDRHQSIPPLSPLSGYPLQEPCLAWQFSTNSDDWAMHNSYAFTLYKKKDLKELFTEIDYSSPEELLYEWGRIKPLSDIGIAYSTARAITLTPLRGRTPLSKEMLLEVFDNGLKIDITPYFRIQGPSWEHKQPVVFILRE